MKRVLWWLLAGSRGGANRAAILRRLRERPYNAHQLAEALGLDYKTVRHHLGVLEENQAIVPGSGPRTGRDEPEEGATRRYGEMWFLTPLLEQNWAIFEEIWAQVAPKEGSG